MPALEAAEKALDIISKKDIEYLKALPNPPAPVKAVMHALCIIYNPPVFEKKKEDLRTVIDWWATAKKILNNPRLIQELQAFDRENM